MLTALFIMKERIERDIEEPLPQDEIDWLMSIRTIDDILNHPDDERFNDLAYDAALALGLSKHDAMSAAGDI
jgi:hypothetical protein